ncbi:helix-turn-helix transcriptional regulator, partial [Dyella sp.]|uniref:helix-turn-helix transcriptional regulator n=1 Tax=Dyella sp. TaxID=1869338 RepID=UPI002ED1BADC
MRNTGISRHEDTPRAVVATGNDYATHYVLPPHGHKRAQLLYAMTGVMTVITNEGSWVIPPRRALWIPAGVLHEVHMGGPVSTRSAYVQAQAAQDAGLPSRCAVIAVSPLLHELLLEAVDLPTLYELDGRDGLVMRLLLEEVRRMPTLALNTPLPSERRLAALCRHLLAHPSQDVKIDDIAARAGMSRRHFTRMFREQTGMSFAAWRQQACLLVALTRLGKGEPVTQVAMD